MLDTANGLVQLQHEEADKLRLQIAGLEKELAEQKAAAASF